MLTDRKKSLTKTCFVAIGANLTGKDGAPTLQICERALRSICALAAANATAGCPAPAPIRSRWFSTAPMPPSSQPRYVNGVVRLATTLGAATLLEALQAIETAEGRTRAEPNAARTLDLDLIDLDGLIRAAPDPILPHPRAHLRAFVLLPLQDVCPTWQHPVTKTPIAALVARLPVQDIRAL